MKTKKIYFVGIKGVGMTALAVYCKEKGYDVLGSDVSDIFHTDKILQQFSIPIFESFSKQHITPDMDLVIYSGAYDIKTHPEIMAAINYKIKILSHGQALGMFMKGKTGISVAGTHGKTTSSALIATILTQAGLDPSFVIGCANISTLTSPGHCGKGKYFVAEADEYQTAVNAIKKSRFLWQKPKIILLTNIDYDHPDIFKNITEVIKTFELFISKIPRYGLLVYHGEDNYIKSVLPSAKCRLISYGETKNNQYSIRKISFLKPYSKIYLNTPNGEVQINLHIPGLHNALNAAGVYALCESLKIKQKDIIEGIKSFKGTKRRFEKIKDENGILYYDDYAHHPTEIKKTLQSVKNWFPERRIIVIFQPHTYSRTQTLLNEFVKCFSQADKVIITNIYSSVREKPQNYMINSQILAKAIKKQHNDVLYAADNSEVLKYINKIKKKNDLILTMGAGDIYKIHNIL